MAHVILPHITSMDIQRIRHLLKPIKGVILDVDGTLTIPGLINFKRLRERANIPIGCDIFPYILSHYKGEEYKKAMAVVEEEELIAQEKVKLQKNANDLIALLNQRNIKVAILTRNGFKSMEKTKSLFSATIDVSICRDFQPSKPNIDPFIKICNDWHIQPSEVLLAGDHLDDFIAAIQLHSVSCFVRPQFDASSHIPVMKSDDGLSLENCQQCPDYIKEYKKEHTHYIPDIVVDCIGELFEAWKNV